LHLYRHHRAVLTLFLLFARFLPMIAMSEVKGVLAKEKQLFAKETVSHQ